MRIFSISSAVFMTMLIERFVVGLNGKGSRMVWCNGHG
jgi:hypothetical protein